MVSTTTLLLLAFATLSLAAPAPKNATSTLSTPQTSSARPTLGIQPTTLPTSMTRAPLSAQTVSPSGRPSTPQNSTLTTLTRATPTALRPSATTSLRPKASNIGNIAAPPITVSNDPKRPFAVDGNTFADEDEALDRACSIQNNRCADAVNAGTVGAEVSDCKDQEGVCLAFGP